MARRCPIALLATAALAATLGLLSACGSDEAAEPETTTGEQLAGTTSTAAPATTAGRPAPPPGTVDMIDFTFSPRDLVIRAGDTVTWRNEDPYAHWVVSTEPDVLDSGEMSQAQVYSKPFPRAGTYTYYCNIHNYMKATVTVQ